MAPRPIPPENESRFFAGLRHASEFFAGEADVQRAMARLARVLEEDGIPYAIVGGMALNEYGYKRVTTEVDVLLSAEGFAQLKLRRLGNGYVEQSRRSLRDTQNDVAIDVLITGEYPGDRKPKPVAFPDPAFAAERVGDLRLLPLERLIELKLASGISAPHRLRDLADVLELIRVRSLPRNFELQLDPSVREKYRELWEAAQHRDDE